MIITTMGRHGTGVVILAREMGRDYHNDGVWAWLSGDGAARRGHILMCEDRCVT